MKALDTNVLISYLVQDDPIQGAAAALIEAAAAFKDQIILTYQT